MTSSADSNGGGGDKKSSKGKSDGNGGVGDDDYEGYSGAALSARELEWANNPVDVIKEHLSHNDNGKIIRTRFPPEPNGYLHIGHAKSMNMNFRLAFEKLKVPLEYRRTIFRYDDTNPDAESTEYIESLENDLKWLGWKPERTTFSSENFDTLYELAIQLITKGLAYVCDMSKSEMEIQRELAMRRVNAKCTGKDPDVIAPIPSPDILPGRNRNKSIERNLEMFERMKLGFYNEGEYTLRLKMDFESANPNMYDLVAYRIKYTKHPHVGSKWCIYPSYDYTHGICDSLEHIDYSICTLEFETRREPYYWILYALNMYRPSVYEMSRLNVQYTVLSKRRLIKLVDKHIVRGWDDPRMPTISGLRRRGYTANIVNSFCNDVGATRAANVVEITKLQQTARTILATTSKRVMAALVPVKIIITNYQDEVQKSNNNSNNKEDASDGNHNMTVIVQNSPTDPNMGTHTITLTETIYIDRSDFRLMDSPQYYGLAPNKAVGLKYHGGNLICDQVIYNNNNKKDTKVNNNNNNSDQDAIDTIQELHCHLDTSEERSKPKTYISWVPSNSICCEVRVYDHLFTVPEPTDLWEDEINPTSEVVHTDALVDPSILEILDHSDDDAHDGSNDGFIVDRWKSTPGVQFERMGYFNVDYDSTYNTKSNKDGKLVFNRTVSLKEEVYKKQLTKEEEDAVIARQNKAKQDVLAKERRMQIEPIDLFRIGDEYVGKYSQYNLETGIPTHDKDGIELTKSAIKKLEKEKQKHIKQVTKWKAQQQQQKSKS